MKQGLIFLLGIFLFFVSSEAAAQCGCDFVIAPETWHFDGAALGVKPGDKICFKSGTRSNIEIYNIKGTAANPVIITNMCDGKVIVAGSTTMTTPFGIGVYQSSYF